jgi:hypothetical protein
MNFTYVSCVVYVLYLFYCASITTLNDEFFLRDTVPFISHLISHHTRNKNGVISEREAPPAEHAF